MQKRFTLGLGYLVMFLGVSAAQKNLVIERLLLFTKSCDTVSVDSMICLKCENPELTVNCRKYVCDFNGNCIIIPAPPTNRLTGIKGPKIITKKK
jgi:hypothetical protein